MRIAIVGSGVSGLVAAHLLGGRHEITVFEERERIGGHVHTVHADDGTGATRAIDMGFIVYNEHNYPLFTKLLDRLGVTSQPSDMSFGVRCDRTGVEYGTSGVRSMLARPANALSPRFYRMVLDILRFNRESGAALEEGSADLTLGEYLEAGRFSRSLVELYLIPMGSALWSIPPGKVLEMPAALFVRFFQNHGMLSVDDQPQWRVIQGGSRRYVDALVAPFRHRIRTSAPVRRVERSPTGVSVDGEAFDHVVLACHSDQALAILSEPSAAEREILGALPYQTNDVVLHTDTSVLPKARRAWASWNYWMAPDYGAAATVTYNMNRLQTLDSRQTFCVTLNATDRIDPERVIHRVRFGHPVYTRAGMAAQRRRDEISGLDRTHFCGAYWGFGFHEDGVRSAVNVAKSLGVTL